MTPDRERPCPCGSGNSYHACCEPFHLGRLPESALKLMRSRYSAYARRLPEYIISTTHPGNAQSGHDSARRLREIVEFCVNTTFNGLEILDCEEKGEAATVTFTAHLSRNQKDVSFTEKSYFEKIGGKWFYHSGQIGKAQSGEHKTGERNG